LIFDESDCVIGLDISTSCTGVAFLTLSGDIITLDYCRPKGDSLVEKTTYFKKYFDKLWVDNGLPIPKKIYVEQNLQKFRRGFSSAQVLNTLARFNGMISYLMYQHFEVQPTYINVNEGRKALGIKIPRGSDTKEEILKWCQHRYPNVEWPEKKLKSGPRKGLVILDPCCYDISDALITATAGLKLDDIS